MVALFKEPSTMLNSYRTDREIDMRPLIQLPSWDGKLVLAGLFIIGYYSLVFIMAWRPLPVTNAGLVRDAMLTLGPVVGLIFGSLFRTTGAEERNAALRSDEVKTAIMAAPSTPVVVQPAAEPEAIGHRVEEGARKGVADGLDDHAEPVPLAADGQRRDWLDPPAYAGPDSATFAPAENPSWQ
jgi:hypothetical protein